MTLVWLLFALVAIEIAVTYSRLPARELYHVSGSGLEGGASRALVFLNFPVALVAIVLLVLLADAAATRLVTAVAVVGVALSAAVFWPGVVDQGNLDARPVNAVAALGVLVALALTVAVARTGRWRPPRGRQAGDRARVAAGVAALVSGVPWLAADLGFFLDGVPLLGWLFETGHFEHNVAGLPPFPPAVHHGHHHGMDGVLLLLAALLLSRLVPPIRRRWLRAALGAYLALMAAYGIGNIANDAWLEQIVRRGWTSWEIPSVLQPRLTAAWGCVIVGAVALYALSALTQSRRPSAPPPSPRAL